MVGANYDIATGQIWWLDAVAPSEPDGAQATSKTHGPYQAPQSEFRLDAPAFRRSWPGHA